MSKTYSDQIEKVQMLTAGVKKNLEALNNPNVTPELIERIEAESLKALEMNREVEEIRADLKQKTADRKSVV